MKRGYWIVLIAIVVIVATIAYYRSHRRLSPAGSASLTNGQLTVSVEYSRPYAKGRVIFGSGEGALQPFGKYWRLGANEPTEISFNKDVLINNQKVEAGQYRIYAIPGSDLFELRLNRDLKQPAAQEPDHSQDFLTMTVPVRKTDFTEQFTVDMKPIESPAGVDVIFTWTDIRFDLPVYIVQ